jgi:outer membrane protein OmpA-like peptidoglycan-associated protein
MATTVHDDYLGCGDYQANIGNASATHKGFSTFEKNGDHYFAWVNGNDIVMRSEAYPDADKMERGIQAILKNCDIAERYAVIDEDGKKILVLYGGGDHQKHTGNFEKHSEIGRSCPHNTREDLNALLQFKGADFANKVVPMAKEAPMAAAAPVAAAAEPAAPVAAAAAVVAAAASTVAATTHTATAQTEKATNYAAAATTGTEASGGGMGWLKWLLPLLLLGGAFMWWKSCNSNKDADATIAGTETTAAVTTAGTDSSNTTTMAAPKVTVDTLTGVVNYELGDKIDVEVCAGTKLTGIATNGFENTLLNFIKTGTIDTVDKTKNWFTMHDVQFVSAKTTYATPNALQQIKNIAAILKCNPDLVLKLGGYTDVRGNDAYNKDLSNRRAMQVSKDLIANGAAASQIKEAVGYGEEFAKAAEGDVTGMAYDRKTAAKVAKK